MTTDDQPLGFRAALRQTQEIAGRLLREVEQVCAVADHDDEWAERMSTVIESLIGRLEPGVQTYSTLVQAKIALDCYRAAGS